MNLHKKKEFVSSRTFNNIQDRKYTPWHINLNLTKIQQSRSSVYLGCPNQVELRKCEYVQE